MGGRERRGAEDRKERLVQRTDRWKVHDRKRGEGGNGSGVREGKGIKEQMRRESREVEKSEG